MLEDNAVLGYKGCPNKCNIYHKCTTFCVKRWGDGIKKPSEQYVTRQKRLLKKYPLPKHWREVYDHGFGMHYYWNAKDDTVAWLPPLHPKSEISKSAATMRRELDETDELPKEDDDRDLPTISDAQLDEIFSIHRDKKRSGSPGNDHMAKKSKSRDSERHSSRRRDDRGRDDRGSRDDRREKDRRDDRDRNRDRHRGREHHRKKPAQDEPLDPMDPAAYSDCPRGKWSDGLAPEGEKEAADSTVTGTAFQSRPYPSPGDVLKANAEKNGKSAEESGEGDEDMEN